MAKNDRKIPKLSYFTNACIWLKGLYERNCLLTSLLPMFYGKQRSDLRMCGLITVLILATLMSGLGLSMTMHKKHCGIGSDSQRKCSLILRTERSRLKRPGCGFTMTLLDCPDCKAYLKATSGRKRGVEETSLPWMHSRLQERQGNGKPILCRRRGLMTLSNCLLTQYRKGSVLSPKQEKVIREAILEDTPPVVILDGSINSGKSHVSNEMFFLMTERLANTTKLPYLIMGKTERTAERNVIDPLQRLFGNLVDYKRGTLYIRGHKCEIYGANDVKSEGKIRGGKYAGALLDEVTLYPKGILDRALGNIMAVDGQLIATCNPDSPYHYIKKEFIDSKDKKQYVYSAHFSLHDNPINTLEFIEKLERLFTGVFYERMILGKWVIAEGIIYRSFEHSRNVTQIHPGAPERVLIGIDYGISADPTVYGKHYLKNGRWYKADEWWYKADEHNGREMSDRELADAFDNFVGKDLDMLEAVIIDPSAASFRVELEQRGYNVVLANNDVLYGIRIYGSMIQAGEIVIYEPNCPNSLREFTLFRWDEDAAMRGTTKPLKEHDHTKDEERYVAVYIAEEGWSGMKVLMPGVDRPDTLLQLMQMGLYNG